MVALPSRERFTTHPELVWVQRKLFTGWACSQCAWQFNPTGPVVGHSMTEMVEKYQKQRDDEFKALVCAKQPARS